MAQKFALAVVSPNEPRAETVNVLRIGQVLRSLAAEHACALRAAAKAQRPRRGRDELRAWYCGERPNGG